MLKYVGYSSEYIYSNLESCHHVKLQPCFKKTTKPAPKLMAVTFVKSQPLLKILSLTDSAETLLYSTMYTFHHT